MLRARAAASADELRTGGIPSLGLLAEFYGIALSCPTTGFCVPVLAGVGVDDDRLGGCLAQLGDEAGNPDGLSAVDADGYGLRKARGEDGTVAESFSMSYLAA